ncbi:hypothetical protein EV363DRAFT_1339393, partial [Boletus edulis]
IKTGKRGDLPRFALYVACLCSCAVSVTATVIHSHFQFPWAFNSPRSFRKQWMRHTETADGHGHDKCRDLDVQYACNLGSWEALYIGSVDRVAIFSELPILTSLLPEASWILYFHPSIHYHPPIRSPHTSVQHSIETGLR